MDTMAGKLSPFHKFLTHKFRINPNLKRKFFEFFYDDNSTSHENTWKDYPGQFAGDLEVKGVSYI